MISTAAQQKVCGGNAANLLQPSAYQMVAPTPICTYQYSCVDVWLHLHTCLSLEAAGCHCIMRYAFGRYLKLVPNILLAYSCFCCFIVATLTFLVIRLFHLFSGKSCKTCWNARKIIVSMLEESIIRVCVQVFVCVSVYMMPKLW